MNVLVNALPLRHGGGVTYLQHQLQALGQMGDGVSYHTLLSPWTQLSTDGLPGTFEIVPVRSVATRYAWEQFRLPLRKTDVLYCPANFAPLAPRRTPMLLTIHNAHYFRHQLEPAATREMRPMWKAKASHWSMRRADLVVSISRCLAEDAAATVPAVASKLRVVHHGLSEWPTTGRRIPLPKPYIVTVASAAPHKRVEDVVAAWSLSRDMTSRDVALVLVGGFTETQMDAHRQAARHHQNRLMHVGRVTDRAVMRYIYEEAQAMALMSTLESFSMTATEAGSLGCRLLLSDIPAHREVADGHATFLEPHDIQGLARALATKIYDALDVRDYWSWPITWADHARQIQQIFFELSQ